MTAPVEPKVEITPAGEALSVIGRGKGTFTAQYDVICSRCGPLVTAALYPTACATRIDHLCRPGNRRS